jgi:MFS family permease
MDSLCRRAIDMEGRFPGVVWLLGFASFINMAGLSLLWPVNSIYIHTVLHKPLTDAGLVLMVWAGAGFIGSFCGGWLCDYFGAAGVLGGSLSVACVVIMFPVFTSGWWAYIGVMAVFGIACAVPFPILNTLVGHAWPEGARRGYNFIYVASNLGVAVGTALGGVLAQWSFRAVFVGIAISYLVFFLLVVTVLRSRFAQVHRATKTQAQVTERMRTTDVGVIPWVPILMLFVGIMMVWSVYVQWMCTIPVYMQALGYPLSWYSLLWTINGLLVFALQPAVAVVVRKFPSLSLHMTGGVILYIGAYAIVAVGTGYGNFVVGMVIMTIGELFAWPAFPAAVEQMAPAYRLGVLQGMIASAGGLGRMVGPVIGGYLYDRVVATTMLWFFILGGLAAVLCFVLFHRFYNRHLQGRIGTQEVGAVM